MNTEQREKSTERRWQESYKWMRGQRDEALDRARAAETRVEALRLALKNVRHESTYRGPDRLRHIARVALEADDLLAPSQQEEK